MPLVVVRHSVFPYLLFFFWLDITLKPGACGQLAMRMVRCRLGSRWWLHQIESEGIEDMYHGLER
jgi:hypothetical protein